MIYAASQITWKNSLWWQMSRRMKKHRIDWCINPYALQKIQKFFGITSADDTRMVQFREYLEEYAYRMFPLILQHNLAFNWGLLIARVWGVKGENLKIFLKEIENLTVLKLRNEPLIEMEKSIVEE